MREGEKKKNNRVSEHQRRRWSFHSIVSGFSLLFFLPVYGILLGCSLVRLPPSPPFDLACFSPDSYSLIRGRNEHGKNRRDGKNREREWVGEREDMRDISRSRCWKLIDFRQERRTDTEEML